jgi:hypothetical protein
MRAAVAILMCVAVAGCLSFKADQRIVGRFTASDGEVLDISSDGWIQFVSPEKKEFVGLARVSTKSPLTIQVFGPDTSAFLGTKIVFSPDFKSIDIEWQDFRKEEGRNRPSKFQKE